MITKAQQKLIRSLEQKKYRQREGLFVAEGPKVVGDLMEAGFQPEMLFVEQGSRFEVQDSRFEVRGTRCEVTADELRRISFLQHPQGVLAVFRIPTATHHSPTPPGSRRRARPG